MTTWFRIAGILALFSAISLQTLRRADAAPPTGKKLAFLVGINNYQHAKLDPLQFAERDVEELALVLENQGYAVSVLTPGTGKKDEKLFPTRENIDSRLKELLRKATREDQILIALAGHGIQPDGAADSYFCPLDGNPSVEAGQGAQAARAKFPETLLAITGKQGLLVKLDDSGIGRKLLLIDACRNDPESGRGRGVGSTITELPERTWLLLSCSARQRAWETGKLGGGHGVFFHFVLEGLRGKAADNEGEVTWNRLSEYVTRQVEKRVPEIIGDGATQSPDEKRSGSGVPILAVVSRPVEATPTKPKTTRTAPKLTSPNLSGIGSSDQNQRSFIVVGKDLYCLGANDAMIWTSRLPPPSNVTFRSVRRVNDTLHVTDSAGTIHNYDPDTGKYLGKL